MIFVTGGTGLVGTHLIMRLLEQNLKIKAIYRSEDSLSIFKKMETWYQKPKGFFDAVEWVKCEFLNEYELNIILKDVETVFHCAAMVSFQPKDKYALEEVNIFGTQHLIDLALANGVKGFYHVSSTAAIGKPKDKSQLITEDILWKKTKNTSNYSISKHFAELEVWRGFEEGLPGAIINPSIVLGPGNWGKSSTSLFKTVNDGLKFYTDGMNGFVDVRDVADSLVLAYQKKINHQRILVVGENKSYKEVFNLMATALKKNPPTIKASKILSSIGWRLLWIWSLITQKDVAVTQETAHSANSKNLYSNKKSKSLLGIEYRSIEDAVKHTASCFLS